MSSVSLINFIHHSGLVSRSMAQEIAGNFSQRDFEKGELLLRAGQVADQYYFLEEGYLRSYALDTDENEVTVGFYTPGEMAFEVASFFSRTRTHENIQALSDGTAWYITFKQLNELFHTVPEFREFGRAMLVRGFTSLKERMLTTITETAEARYQQLVVNQPDLLQHASLKHIATYLGITDTSLSRIRASISKK